MGHITALLIKAVMSVLVLLIVLTGFYHYPASGTISIALLITVLSYIIGDLAILRVSNNYIATIADFLLVTVIIWLVGPFFQGVSIPLYIAISLALVIALGEWFFHHFFIASRSGIRAKV